MSAISFTDVLNSHLSHVHNVFSKSVWNLALTVHNKEPGRILVLTYDSFLVNNFEILAAFFLDAPKHQEFSAQSYLYLLKEIYEFKFKIFKDILLIYSLKYLPAVNYQGSLCYIEVYDYMLKKIQRVINTN